MARSRRVEAWMARLYPVWGGESLDAAFCRHAREGMTVLDAGCGGARGCPRQSPWEKMYIVGLDPDPAVRGNPFCNAVLMGDVSVLPFADASFDLIHCRWVLEHLSEPRTTFREFARVLKPGGRLLAVTPNLFHYATLGARLTPFAFHRWWQRGAYDPFPTFYRANSPRAIRRLCRDAGLLLESVDLIEGPPQYLMRNLPAFLLGVLYERLVNSTPALAGLRQRMVLQIVRDASTDAASTQNHRDAPQALP